MVCSITVVFGDDVILPYYARTELSTGTPFPRTTVSRFVFYGVCTLFDDHLKCRYFTTEEQSSRLEPADRDVFDDLALAQELLSLIPECWQTLDFAWENKAVEVTVSDNPTTVFQKFMGKKPLEKPLSREVTPFQEPPLTLPEYATYLMCARHNLKACWDAFAVDPEVGSPFLSTSSAIAVTSLLTVNPGEQTEAPVLALLVPLLTVPAL